MNTIYKITAFATTLLLAVPFQSQAQIGHAKKETVHVYGNCGMCETTIEKSAFKKGVAEADWDKITDMAVITYDSTKTTLKEILKRIADAGYDNDLFKAPDAAYAKLHACCQYERKPE
jgi:copper chaperone CopZ